MARNRSSSPRWPLVGLAVLVLATAAVVAALFAQQHARTESIAESTYTPPTITPEPTPTPAPIADGTKTVFFGDSWTAGYGSSTPDSKSYAPLVAEHFGLDYAVEAGSGTGYQFVGDNKLGTYKDRLAGIKADPAVQLLVIQGGSNDSGQDMSLEGSAVKQTIAQARITYPSAVIVVVGPAIVKVPVLGDLERIDSALALAAYQENVRYISPYRDQWFNESNVGQMIDVQALYHPNDAGYALFAEKLEQALSD